MKLAATRILRAAALGLFIAALLTATGCGLSRPSRPAVRFYSLDYPAPAARGGKPLPAVIRVERFSSSPELSGTAMIYTDAPYAVKTYSLYKWRATPSDTVAFFLARDMKASGLFSAALPYDTRISPTHSLEGRVEEFHELDASNGMSAVLSISVTLVREREPDVTRKIVFQKTYTETQKAAVNNPQAVAGAMSEAMKRVSIRVTDDITKALAQPSAGK